MDENDIPLPSVPEAETVRAYISVPDREKMVPDVSTLLVGPDDISPESLLFGPGVPPSTVAAYAVGGDLGTAQVEDEVRNWANSLQPGKISKYDAYYFPETPIPYGTWEYRCETCRFYTPPEESTDGAPKCDVVGQKGDFLGGEDIHPSSWCALWMPVAGEGWFEWATDRLEGETDGGQR